MRSVFLVVGVSVVSACEQQIYSDEKCATSSLEGKMKMGPVEMTVKNSGNIAWIPGACMKFGTPITSEKTQKMGGAETKEKTDYAATWGLTGDELGGASYYTFGKDNADGDNACNWDPKKYGEKTAGKTGKDLASINQHFHVLSLSTGLNPKVGTNVCVPIINNEKAAAGYKGKEFASKDGFSLKITCGPVPGAVWGIVLSSIGLVLSFAGLGLAAAAGK